MPPTESSNYSPNSEQYIKFYRASKPVVPRADTTPNATGPRVTLSKNTAEDSPPIFITRIRFLIASAGDVGSFEVVSGRRDSQ